MQLFRVKIGSDLVSLAITVVHAIFGLTLTTGLALAVLIVDYFSEVMDVALEIRQGDYFVFYVVFCVHVSDGYCLAESLISFHLARRILER